MSTLNAAELGEVNRKLFLVVLGSKLAQNHKVGAWIWTSINATHRIHVLISLGKSGVLSLPSIIPGLHLKIREGVQAVQASLILLELMLPDHKIWNNRTTCSKSSQPAWNFSKAPLCAPHTSIFHKSFYETSYEAIKMIYGPFLILVYWTLLSSNIKVNNFPRLTQHRCQNTHCFFTSLEIEK